MIRPGDVAGLPFFEWKFSDHSQFTYIIVAPFQEFFSKGFLLVSLMRIYGKDARILPISVSSLMFASMHVNYGIGMMAFAFILNFSTGWLFLRDKTLWGCAIIHFCLGYFSTSFGLQMIMS
jgi:membrane protease YdiL (CAAX protease family)